ncbi:MAG: hypothetical protein LC633_04245, partial [Desulfobulbaceae bacterium]|nr:hypothetical protein [Desulfobulbaceae bacterium]
IGYAVVVFESIISSLAFKRPLERGMLSRLAGLIPWVLGGYLVVRFQEINAAGLFPYAFSGGLHGNMFLLENFLLLGALLILIYPVNRRSPKMLFISSMLILVGGGLYRLNAYLIGYDSGIGYHYFPSSPELLITFAIIALELMGYIWFVKRFPVLPEVKHA